jgi:hypothetical protein
LRAGKGLDFYPPRALSPLRFALKFIEHGQRLFAVFCWDDVGKNARDFAIGVNDEGMAELMTARVETQPPTSSEKSGSSED